MNDHHDPETTTATEPLVEEALVEEVSIDGMCGVY
jgi:mycofactocin precursor